jgi:hypothetical protein
MITVQKGGRPEDVRQDLKHVLFVEGAEDSIDPAILELLLRRRIRVAALGSSFHTKSAAEALHKYHPYYYFLIDRDHHTQEFVDLCWDKFPDPRTSNLLVWYRRELENYFVIPEYLMKSKYVTASEDQIRERILSICNERFYLELANLVIVAVREELKTSWISFFERVDDFRNRNDALNALTRLPELKNRIAGTSRILNSKQLTSKFDEICEELSEGLFPLQYGRGTWLERMRGKKILPTIVNTCFTVKSADGNFLQGHQRLMEVAKIL